jgi:hypothetical protein
MEAVLAFRDRESLYLCSELIPLLTACELRHTKFCRVDFAPVPQHRRIDESAYLSALLLPIL